MVKRNSIIRLKRNKWRFFSISLIAIPLLTGCFATAPTPEISEQLKRGERIHGRVAVIINDGLKSYIHQDAIYASCMHIRTGYGGYKYYEFAKNGVMRIRNPVGSAIEGLFVEGFAYLFEKVDFFKDIGEIKNKDAYSYILVPDIVINTSYDKKWAHDREIREEYTSSEATIGGILTIRGIPSFKVIKATPFGITASAEFQLQVKDIKNGEVITTFSGKGSWGSSTHAAICTSDPKFYNGPLSENYKIPIQNAMNKAFEELISRARAGLLPADLLVSAQFSDRNSLLPNNVLDVDEEAEIVITAKNNGKGIGYGTNLEVISDNSKIATGGYIKVGDIQPGETKDIRVNLKAEKNLEDSKATFKLNLREKRGYNTKEVVLNVPTSNQINRVVDSIISKLRSQMSQKGWKRVAMAEFGSHTGFYTDLEQYLLREFYTRLGNMKEFSVAEKPLLNQALTALKTTFSDLVNPASKTKILVNHDSVKKLGALTGADVIFMVTVMGMDNSVRIDNIFVDIATGEVYTIAGEDIGKRSSL